MTSLSPQELELLLKIIRRYTATPDHESEVTRIYTKLSEMLYDYRPVV